MLKISRKKVGGKKRGKIIGFPTLNFDLKKGDKIERGVWLVRLKAGGKSYLGAANVGQAKTFGDKEEKIEVHLFTPFRDKSLTGFTKPAGGIKKTEIYFLRYLRKTKKFKTIEELKKQIKKDVKKGLSFLDVARPTNN